ncbi:hypothetical protein ACFVSS_23985, partial [Peribacillus butanolivorans]|uniref:hypothetical protein n=1 Tax=Peribacillus butanolivorans TaxID=421767 RepID=UPI0036DCA8F0
TLRPYSLHLLKHKKTRIRDTFLCVSVIRGIVHYGAALSVLADITKKVLLFFQIFYKKLKIISLIDQ